MSVYAPDFDRGIFIQGEITQAFVDKVTPRVVELQFAANSPEQDPAPLTAFIDSPGGSPVLALRLLDLMRSPRGSGKPHTVISYITGRAASAAADFSIQSDYSYIVDGAAMLCHGTSMGGGGAINVNTAEWLAGRLRQNNEGYAIQTARAAFPRMLFRFISEGGAELAAFITDPIRGLPALVGKLVNRIRSPELRRLLETALERQKHIQNFSAVPRPAKKRKAQSPAHDEADLLRAILNQKLSHSKTTGWSLASGGLEDLVDSFRLHHDYQFGRLNQATQSWVGPFGVMFLTTSESSDFQQLALPEGEERNRWLMDHAGQRIRQLWYFCVSVARLLQGEDYEFGAYDAYWMGLVDEVVGAGLPTVRQLIESSRNAPAQP